MTVAHSIQPWHPHFRTTCTVLLVCFLAILFEGYDVGVMGAVLPALAEDRNWNLSPFQLGALSSYALVGMFFGAFLIGTLSEMMGRRRMLLLCVSVFSLTMLGASWAPTPVLFGILRFIGGLGLGGVIPVAAALTIEYSPPHRRSFNYGLMYSGYSVGILCAALVAMWFLPSLGWRGVIGLGAVPIVLIPLMAWMLPESQEYLVGQGRISEAQALANRTGNGRLQTRGGLGKNANRATWRDVMSSIFARRQLRATACFWMALFFGLLLVYGLNTWLPTIMRKNGYDLGSSLSFLVVFSLASALGGLFLGGAADKMGARGTVTSFYLIGSAAIGALMFRNSVAINYLLMALAGVGSVSASLILTGYLAGYYPAHARAAATGWALSFARCGAMCGPLLGGYVAGSGLSFEWNFITFSIAGLAAALAVGLLPSAGRRVAVAHNHQETNA
ncbi:AAHS family benzoate transporter-like MFS transporter [Cupriavidus phytorum]|uniref:AAHS family benzoate transporter-like MFS transporter n=1 Tax=Cupriavidus phytorum TaxID=3024399 RepID=A0A2W7P6I2_9BURK|nr:MULTISPECIES: aromatic acid/H+ symport family MFS transporter [Cupriavidus]PZX26953.1 AAHS family benzoate transporter-like MFS transporter [Cupriavidus alkaliphilus]